MAIASNALKIDDLTSVIGTVHGAIALNFEKYATTLEGGDFTHALACLADQHALLRQAGFLVAELSVAYGDLDGAEPASDPRQMDLLSPVEREIACRGACCDPETVTDVAEQIRQAEQICAPEAQIQTDTEGRPRTPEEVSERLRQHINLLYAEITELQQKNANQFATIKDLRQDLAEAKNRVGGNELLVSANTNLRQRNEELFAENKLLSEQNNGHLTWHCKNNEAGTMEALAQRIVGNASPDEDSRLEVAYAIARHLGLDWPAAQLPEKELAREDVRDPIHVVANNVSFELANMAYGENWMYAHGAANFDPAAAITAEQVAKVVADKPLSTVAELPRGGESIQQLELPTGLVPSEVLVADTEAAARVCGSLVPFFVDNGQPTEANVLADAEEILLRGTGGAAAVRRATEPQTFPAVAAGDMALFDNFAVNPGVDQQLIVGLLGTDNVLVWQMAGEVPEGAFTTMRQRLQMFADTADCVALARVRS